MKDIFIKNYRVMDEAKQQEIENIKEKASELYDLMDGINNREMSLAKTNLEQAIMWCTKAVVLDFIAQNKV